MVRQEHESCDIENPNHSDSKEPRHTRNNSTGICRKSFIGLAIIIALLFLVWYTAPEIASLKTSGLSDLRLNRKNGEGDNLSCKGIDTNEQLGNIASGPQIERHDEAGSWQGYSENNVPGLHGQNNADHEYNSFGEKGIESKTFENKNRYQPPPGHYQRNKQFPVFNNVPQEYSNGYPAYNSYLDLRKDYPVYRDQPPRNNQKGKNVYDEEYLQNTFDIPNRPESAWQNTGNKIESPGYPNYKAADEQIPGSATKISNALASFEKQQEIDRLAEGPPIQGQMRKQESEFRKDLSMQPGKIQDLSVQRTDVQQNGQYEKQEVQPPKKQRRPEEQHQQQDHQNTHLSQTQREEHALNKEEISSPDVNVPQQNDVQIKKIKVIAAKDIQNQHSKTGDASSFHDDTVRQKSTSQKTSHVPDPQVRMAKASAKQPKEPLVKLRVQPDSLTKSVEDWRLPNSYRNQQVSQTTTDDTVDVETKPRVKKIRASQWGSYQHHTKSQNSDVDLGGFPQALLLGCPESGLGRFRAQFNMGF